MKKTIPTQVSWLVALLLMVWRPSAATETDILPLDQVRPGQTGWGLTVFTGTEPERFDVEVVGVHYNRKPELSYIFARLSGHGLEESGVFRGMSGSPVYFDGKLAGAVAFSYAFGIEAIAGITPIEAMRKLGGMAGAPPGAQPASAAPVSSLRTVPLVRWEDLVRREFEPDLVEKHMHRALPGFGSGGRSAIQWSAGGFGQRSAAYLDRALGALAPGGSVPGGALPASSGATSGSVADAGELRPGSSVGAVLVQGDLHVVGYGTVTDVDGDEILAMGHPLYAYGPVRFPMATAEVITVFPSRMDSFKVANVGPVVGAFDQDREAGMHGRIGLDAPMIPVTVRLNGLADHEYHMEVVDVPQLTPNMMALSAYGSLEAGSFASGPQGLDLEARFHLAGHDDLVVRQNFDTNQAGIESILYLLSFGSFLKGNSLAEVDIESLEVDYTQVDRPRTATLIGAHANRRLVRPGETVQLIMELQAYRGDVYRDTAEIVVPRNAPDGRFVIFVGDGTTMDGVRVNVEQRAPQTFEQALEYLQSFSPRRTLRIFGLVSQPGLAVAGAVLPQLPGSVQAIFARGGPTGTPLSLAIALEQDKQLDRPIVGFQRVDLEVRRE